MTATTNNNKCMKHHQPRTTSIAGPSDIGYYSGRLTHIVAGAQMQILYIIVYTGARIPHTSGTITRYLIVAQTIYAHTCRASIGKATTGIVCRAHRFASFVFPSMQLCACSEFICMHLRRERVRVLWVCARVMEVYFIGKCWASGNGLPHCSDLYCGPVNCIQPHLMHTTHKPPHLICRKVRLPEIVDGVRSFSTGDCEIGICCGWKLFSILYVYLQVIKLLIWIVFIIEMFFFKS